MAEEIVGYFHWRQDRRGVPQPSRVLKVHRDMPKHSPNQQEQDYFEYGLLAEHPLDAALWNLSLDDLVKRFPAPSAKE